MKWDRISATVVFCLAVMCAGGAALAEEVYRSGFAKVVRGDIWSNTKTSKLTHADERERVVATFDGKKSTGVHEIFVR